MCRNLWRFETIDSLSVVYDPLPLRFLLGGCDLGKSLLSSRLQSSWVLCGKEVGGVDSVHRMSRRAVN